MIFSDARFILEFFPLAFLLIYLLRLSQNKTVVTAGFILISFAFYMQWNAADLVVVISSIAINFAISNMPGLSRRLRLWLCVGINVGYLFFLKYIVATGLMSTEAAGTGNLFGTLGLPLGISFITFQQISFVVDQAENRDREPNPLRYMFFVLFFPHLVAGPLVPHRLLCAQIDRKPFLRISPVFFRVGLAYFAIGLAKKVILAEPLNSINNDLFAITNDLSMPEAWFNAFVYSFRIYFDFSAYSDMATGLAYIMGIQFPRNFQSPYKSRTIFTFWHSWHISLYKFFRQYLYVRLMGVGFFKRNVALAMLVVMILSAMWHGVGWGYIIWGFGHAVAMILTRYAVKRGWLAPDGPSSRIGRLISTVSIFVLVTTLWIPFAVSNLHDLARFGERLLSFTMGFGHIKHAWIAMLLIPALVTFSCPNSHQICMVNRRAAWLLPLGIGLFCLALPVAVGRLAPPAAFIYFQF